MFYYWRKIILHCYGDGDVFSLMLIVKCRSKIGKKACVWQQRGPSRWQADKLLLARWESRYCAEILTHNGSLSNNLVVLLNTKKKHSMALIKMLMINAKEFYVSLKPY